MKNRGFASGLGFCVAVVMLCGLSNTSWANVRLPSLFSTHAVFQQDVIVPVWGNAEPGEAVAVTFGAQVKPTKADANGKWSVKLDKLKSGGPYTLTVKGKNTVVVEDVLVGEVWLGSGQSNMEMTVGRAKDIDKEKAAADLPKIRMFTVTSSSSVNAKDDCAGKWVVCSTGTVASFSATLYFCGREIHKELGVPVGLIHSSVGGTPIEAWFSLEAQKASPEMKEYVAEREQGGGAANKEAAVAKYQKALSDWTNACEVAKTGKKALPKKPAAPLAKKPRWAMGSLFNGKIAPLIPYAIRGAVWYQGESNAIGNQPELYQYQLPLLVKDWRARWGYDFPFAWVQLPNYKAAGDGWMIVREAMLQSLKIPNTGMAIGVDVGNPVDIHPKNKQEIGRRLSLWALGAVYGKEGEITGPLPDGHKISGNKIVCSFKHCRGGLVARGGALKGFVIAGSDRQWKAATASISGDTVIVSHPDIKTPVAVRYAWAAVADCNLYNGAGLPASPFRTDDWPVGKPK